MLLLYFFLESNGNTGFFFVFSWKVYIRKPMSLFEPILHMCPKLRGIHHLLRNVGIEPSFHYQNARIALHRRKLPSSEKSREVTLMLNFCIFNERIKDVYKTSLSFASLLLFLNINPCILFINSESDQHTVIWNIQ